MEAYKSIVSRFRKNGMLVDLQILDNEASAEYKCTITEEWVDDYQLVLPDIHRHKVERSIRTFEAHFLSILEGIARNFPKT